MRNTQNKKRPAGRCEKICAKAKAKKLKWPLTTVVSPQSRVISVHSWYLTSFVILSFVLLPFAINCYNAPNTLTKISKRESSLFSVYPRSKRRVWLFRITHPHDRHKPAHSFLVRRAGWFKKVLTKELYDHAFYAAALFFCVPRYRRFWFGQAQA